MGLFTILKAIFNTVCCSAAPESQAQQPHGTTPESFPSQLVHKPPISYPPPAAQHPVSTPSRLPTKPYIHEDQNQINQHNEHYMSLRARANEEGDRMAKCFEESHQAYARGEGARAKELSNKGKEHQRNMVNLNREASEWIFIENNKDSKSGEVDLHGLYVKEAIMYTDRALEEAKKRGDKEIRLIVGKGLHSQSGAAKIKPSIEQLMEKHKLEALLDSNNAGVLVVQLDADRSRGVGPDEIARRIESGGERCIIM